MKLQGNKRLKPAAFTLRFKVAPAPGQRGITRTAIQQLQELCPQTIGRNLINGK
jgi:hypothetical protein